MSLFVGIGPPLASTLTVTSSTIDLTTVSAVAWQVTRPGGDVVTWPATLGTVSPSSLVTTHAHASDDVPRKGAYSIRALLTVPGGVVPTAPVTVTVTR